MFEPRRFRIGNLLNASSKFMIPSYQRDYKWGKEEAQELIEDLNNYSSSRESSLFLGTIILEENRLPWTAVFPSRWSWMASSA